MLLPGGKCRGSHHGLSQAQSAIAARNFGMSKYLEVMLEQQLLQAFCKIDVLKSLPGKADVIQFITFAHCHCCARQHVSQSIMESAADHARQDSIEDIAHDLPDEFRAAYLPFPQVFADETLSLEGR